MILKQIDTDCINAIKQLVIVSLNYLNLKVKKHNKEYITYEDLTNITKDDVYQRLQYALTCLYGNTRSLTTLESLFEVEEYNSQEPIPTKLFLNQINKSLSYMGKHFVKSEIKNWEQ